MPTKKPKSTGTQGFKKLKALPCYDEMYEKIIAGVALEEVARWLQEDMFQMLDIKQDSLLRQLYRFKGSIPAKDLVKNPPIFLSRAIEKMKRGVNEIDELEKLYLLQIRRISMDAETEERISKLFDTTNKEISLAAELLNKMLNAKMELGLLEKTPVHVSIEGEMSVSNSDSLDDDTRMKMGVVAQKLLSMMDTVVKEKKEESTDG